MLEPWEDCNPPWEPYFVGPSVNWQIPVVDCPPIRPAHWARSAPAEVCTATDVCSVLSLSEACLVGIQTTFTPCESRLNLTSMQVRVTDTVSCQSRDALVYGVITTQRKVHVSVHDQRHVQRILKVLPRMMQQAVLRRRSMSLCQHWT
jgi:hypothetical protein